MFSAPSSLGLEQETTGTLGIRLEGHFFLFMKEYKCVCFDFSFLLIDFLLFV
jgi:hypothetical protein